jgi:hypothetical protein
MTPAKEQSSEEREKQSRISEILKVSCGSKAWSDQLFHWFILLFFSGLRSMLMDTGVDRDREQYTMIKKCTNL